MSLLKLDLQSKPMDVAISKSGTRLAVVSAEDLAVYSLDLSKRPVAVPIPLWRSDAIKGHNARHVAFLGDEHVCVLSDSWEEEDTNLWISFGEELLDRGVISEKGRPSTFVPSVDYEKLYLQYQDASVYEVSPEDVPSIPVHRFPSFAPETRIAIQDDKVRRAFRKLYLRILISAANMFWVDEDWRSLCQ
jgi:elongator complex protein 1